MAKQIIEITIGVSPFRLFFLICQLEDINPKGLTLIMTNKTERHG